MTKSAATTRSIIIEREMPHPPERVWRALTQGALIEEWLMENDFQPVVGHRFNFRATPMPHWNGIVDCQVLVVEPNQRLSYSWNASGERGGERTKDPRHLDIDPDKGRRSAAYGAVGLPARRRSQLSGRKLWLAVVHRRPGTGGRGARLKRSTPGISRILSPSPSPFRGWRLGPFNETSRRAPSANLSPGLAPRIQPKKHQSRPRAHEADGQRRANLLRAV